jgi:hypothetical protein
MSLGTGHPAFTTVQAYVDHCLLHNKQIDPIHISDVCGVPIDVVEFIIAERTACRAWL